MNQIQKHRGPDGDGVFEDPESGVGLGHVRLAILDLSTAANQPMISPDGRYVLVFNGEIYNFKELRNELKGKGWVFRSTGDTEVLLAGLAIKGMSFVKRLNGIFAFAFWDRKERRLLLARDPLGVKPLYWVEPKPGLWVFASEIKALLQHPDVGREPDFLAIQEHLARGHASGTRTAFKGIFRLAPMHLMVWEAGRPEMEIREYWNPDLERNETSYENMVEKLREVVEAGVVRQMVSDVPIGIFLSGGLDSSAITLLSKRKTQRPIQCFTISYPSSENQVDQFVNDLPYARKVAESVGFPFNNIKIKPDITHLLPSLIAHLDEPLADPAIITCYLICKLARERGVPVLLSGQGADELFGGYPRYAAVEATRWLEAFPMSLRRMMAGAARALPAVTEGWTGAFLRRLRRVVVDIDKSADVRFMAYASAEADGAICSVFSPAIQALFDGRPSAECSLKMMTESHLTGGNRYIQRDMADYLPNHNLLYTDKISMSVGVETRVPLLDLEIVQLANSLPFSFKCKGKTTKRIFRDAMRGIVSEEVLKRPKAGFGAPYRKWLRYDLHEMWNDLFSDSSIRERGWFDPAGLRAIRKTSDDGVEDLYFLQWALLSLELWAREFGVN